MKNLIKSGALAALACSLIATPVLAEHHESDAQDMTRGEKKLARLLEGREAGEPTNCITTIPNGNLQIIDGTALVYKRGKTVWVNRTRNPDSLDDSDYLVIKKYGSANRLCRLDNVTTHDRGSNFFSGVVMLTDFVPYRLKDNADG